MITPFLALSWWAYLILRVAVGAVLVSHGLPKLKDLKKNAQNFAMMGFKPGAFWGTIIALLESVGGLLLILGWFSQLIGLLVAIEFATVVIWRIKNGQKLVGGFELDLLMAVTGIVLATSGGGYYALDNYLPFVLY
jgi:putative oxidoreductase